MNRADWAFVVILLLLWCLAWFATWLWFATDPWCKRLAEKCARSRTSERSNIEVLSNGEIGEVHDSARESG